VEKLTSSVTEEVRRLNECIKPGVEDMGACLGINGLEQAKLYAHMEVCLVIVVHIRFIVVVVHVSFIVVVVVVVVVVVERHGCLFRDQRAGASQALLAYGGSLCNIRLTRTFSTIATTTTVYDY